MTDTICPKCGEECTIIALDNAFDYSGTHCTGGRSGTHYPSDYGTPVSDCCEAPMECDIEEDDWRIGLEDYE